MSNVEDFNATNGGSTPSLNLPLYADDDRPTWRGHVNYTNRLLDAAHGRVMGRFGDFDVQIGDVEASKIGEADVYRLMSSTGTVYYAANGSDTSMGTLPGQPKKSLTSLSDLAAGTVAHIGPGKYDVNSSMTVDADLVIHPNAEISVNGAAILDIRGTILTNGSEIFKDGGGTVALLRSRNTYNLGWFSSGTNSINARWNFARRDMRTFGRKRILIPQALPNQSGTWTDPNGYRTYWLFDGPIEITDQHNTSTWQVDGEFRANANCEGFFVFNDAAKPENIYFYGDININVPANITVNYGIKSLGCARVMFLGMVVINGARTSVMLGSAESNAPTGEVRFLQLQCSFFSVCAVSIYGRTAQSAQNIQIDRLTASAAQMANLNVVEIRGLIRNLSFPEITYATDAPKDGYVAFDAENVVYIESNSEGTINVVKIDNIYQANANVGIKTTTSTVTPQTASAITNVSVEQIWAKYNGTGANIDYATETTINRVMNPASITIGSNANYTKLRGAYSAINDSGSYTIVNGMASTNRGSGTLPSPALNWPIGTFIREIGDGKLYLRVAKTGNQSDYVLV